MTAEVTYRCNGCGKDEYEVSIPEHAQKTEALYIRTADYGGVKASLQYDRGAADLHFCTECSVNILSAIQEAQKKA